MEYQQEIMCGSSNDSNTIDTWVTSKNIALLTRICLHKNRGMHAYACNFNCRVEIEVFLKAKEGSHTVKVIKMVIISEPVRDRDVY